MSYWDTSALVKLYAQVPDSGQFVQHLAHSAAQPTTRSRSISRVALYESLAVFNRKESEGNIMSGASKQLHLQLKLDVGTGKWTVKDFGVDVETEFEKVLDVCHRQNPPAMVRTLDALHLACARAMAENEVVTTDRQMRVVAKLLGFTVFPA